jgi:succinate dehydrogenase / fumarate reductase flavoprotein subunit
MQRVMQEDFGVFRINDAMERGLERLDDLRDRLQQACIKDKSAVFNTERIAAYEIDNLMATAYATAKAALARKESRGANSREDFPERDDANWLKHSLYFLEEDTIDYRPVNRKPKYVEPFEPKKRVY